jgi:Type I phosphodiesterase / nucleotide pyrophosphatase
VIFRGELLICEIGVFQPEVFRGCGLSLQHVKHFANNLQPDGLHFTESKIDMFPAMKTNSDRLHPSSNQSALVVLSGLFLLLFSDLTLARNVILFVADGLRQGSVNDQDAPTMSLLRERGVFFSNSHSLFPTLTTPNASAIATGHFLGDTGDYGNAIYTGFPLPIAGQTQIPFVEDDRVLGNLDEHFGGNYLHEETLLSYAAKHGYQTAAIGKLGPILIQDAPEASPSHGFVAIPKTVIIDDSTGRTGGIPLDPRVTQALRDAHLPLISPNRSNEATLKSQRDNGFPGDNSTPGTQAANSVQQQYFADALTKAVLPLFRNDQRPFLVVFWSRDPDGTQHNQGDSLNRLSPGINGPTSKAAVRNADGNLRQILSYLETTPGLADDTDIFLTSDHGFSTISKREIGSLGTEFTSSYAAAQTYKNASGRQEVNTGFLPPGFLAIDLAHFLNLPLFDPDTTITVDGSERYKPVDPTIGQTTPEKSQRPISGSGLIGGTGVISTPCDAKLIVAANGGSDLIYLNDRDPSMVKDLVDFLSSRDYVSGIFTDPTLGQIKGALSLSDLNLEGSTVLPTPAIIVNFCSFSQDASDPLQSAVTVCDTGLQEGQGMHGSFSRADTLNHMAAVGPDFKKAYIDIAPVSNADIAVTLARILHLDLPKNGRLTGRIMVEALAGGPESTSFESGVKESEANTVGLKTRLHFQKVGESQYFDSAGFEGRTVGLPNTEK